MAHEGHVGGNEVRHVVVLVVALHGDGVGEYGLGLVAPQNEALHELHLLSRLGECRVALGGHGVLVGKLSPRLHGARGDVPIVNPDSRDLVDSSGVAPALLAERTPLDARVAPVTIG